ncbi:zinc finger protein 385B-like protein [Camelus ferus]|nr:zinc finger protein 385B-like protein [Camelus ferus]
MSHPNVGPERMLSAPSGGYLWYCIAAKLGRVLGLQITSHLGLHKGMKRPLSPSPPAEKEPPVSGAAECPPRPPEPPKPKRERKRPSYTLCDVCNIQLNSAAQAQVHCGGRAHQRRLRQLSVGKTPAGPGVNLTVSTSPQGPPGKGKAV